MPVMAKSRKKPDSKRTLGENRHTRPRIAFHLPAEHDAALRTLIARTKRTLTAEILIALENHLTQEGLWPPPAAGAGGPTK